MTHAQRLTYLNRGRSLFSLILFLTLAAAAQTPANAPASPLQNSPAAKPVKADDLLANFPKNAARAVKNSRVTIEGRVLESRAALSSEKAGDRLLIVGTNQNFDDPAHITCTFDNPATKNLKPGSLVQITGTYTGAASTGDRLELLHCLDPISIPDGKGASSRFIGHWRSDVALSASGYREWAQRLGWVIDPNARGSAFNPLYVDFLLNRDGTAVEEIRDLFHSIKKYSGRWEYGLRDDAPMLKFDLQGLASAEIPFKIRPNDSVQFDAPGLTEINILPTVVLMPSYIVPVPVDMDRLKKQALQWTAANLAVNNPQSILDTAQQAISKSIAKDHTFAFTFGSNLLKSHHETSLVVIDGRMHTFPYSDAQSNRHPAGGYSTTDITPHVFPAEPEIKIESLTLDAKEQYTKVMNGKITLRALRTIPKVSYMLVMENSRGIAYFYFTTPFHADADTYSFTFKSVPAITDDRQNPVPVFFSICRMETGIELPCQVSDPVPMLLDVVK